MRSVSQDFLQSIHVVVGIGGGKAVHIGHGSQCSRQVVGHAFQIATGQGTFGAAARTPPRQFTIHRSQPICEKAQQVQKVFEGEDSAGNSFRALQTFVANYKAPIESPKQQSEEFQIETENESNPNPNIDSQKDPQKEKEEMSKKKSVDSETMEIDDNSGKL